MKNKIKSLKSKLGELRDLLDDSNDNGEGYIQEIQKLNNIIKSLKNKKSNISNISSLITETALAENTYSVPSNFSWYGSHPVVIPIAQFQVSKGYKYVLTCHTKNTDLGKDDKLFLSAYSNNLVEHTGDTKVILSPNSNDKSLIEFIGNQEDNSKTNRIKLTFKAMIDSVLYVIPYNQSTLYDLTVTSYHYPYNDPDYPNDAEIIVPDPIDSDPNSKNNKYVMDWFHKIFQQLNEHKIDVPNVYSSEDENGNVNYSFTANLVQPKWTFVQAVNQLNYHNGMTRIESKRDSWIELDANDDLVVKFKGNDKLFRYQPSKSDINGHDWVVENNRPFNPNNKPISSDPSDDSSDSNKYGQYDTNYDQYTDNFSNSDDPDDSGNWSNTDLNKK